MTHEPDVHHAQGVTTFIPNKAYVDLIIQRLYEKFVKRDATNVDRCLAALKDLFDGQEYDVQMDEIVKYPWKGWRDDKNSWRK